jgi:quinol-cytochrome oxidoreductase complex cytochrome b subunit
MSNLLQQIYNILTSYPGNLIYHLELTFAIAIAFLVVWIQRRPGDRTTERRVFIGLSILFISRLLTFILAGLAQRTPATTAHRLGNHLLTMWSVWVGFSRPRPADAAAGLRFGSPYSHLQHGLVD